MNGKASSMEHNESSDGSINFKAKPSKELEVPAL